jgi:hypothetical protein
LTLQRHTHIF